jgi:hypothetical protein
MKLLNSKAIITAVNYAFKTVFSFTFIFLQCNQKLIKKVTNNACK